MCEMTWICEKNMRKECFRKIEPMVITGSRWRGSFGFIRIWMSKVTRDVEK